MITVWYSTSFSLMNCATYYVNVPGSKCPSAVQYWGRDSANCILLLTPSWAFLTGRGRQKHRAGGMIGFTLVSRVPVCSLTPWMSPHKVQSSHSSSSSQSYSLACGFSNISRNSLSNQHPAYEAVPVWGCLGFPCFRFQPSLSSTKAGGCFAKKLLPGFSVQFSN